MTHVIGGYVFIAGAYGDHDPWLDIDRRIARVRALAVTLAREGIPFFAPHLNSAHFQAVAPDVPRDFYLAQDDVFRDAAAALLVVEEELAGSAGTQRDIDKARRQGKPTYYGHEVGKLIERWKATTWD